MESYHERAKRFPLQVQVLLELKGGIGFTGKTDMIGISENICKSGLILRTDYIYPSDLSIGTLAILHLIPLQEGFCQPCQVTRIVGDNIAVSFSREWHDFETVVGDWIKLGYAGLTR
jgi:hypothetical protein